MPTSFLLEQKEYARVKEAYEEKELAIKANLKKYNLQLNNINILLVAYKTEKILDVYAKNSSDSKYKKIATYTICKSSGKLGPKRKAGDKQVPEGFYYIDRFNPTSKFYLSLGINYPNQSDKRKSTAKDLGGDIFIHGDCVTVGCLPMTNDKMKEIYIYAIQAKNSGQSKIPVYIFPFRFTNANMAKYKRLYKSNQPLLKFWNNLKIGYEKYNKNQQELKFTIDNKGFYIFD